MQNQNSEKRLMEFRIVSPTADSGAMLCDRVNFNIRDDLSGNGGGSYGVRCGHARAVLSLANGTVTVSRNGAVVWQGGCRDGFVRVEPQSVTLVTEEFSD